MKNKMTSKIICAALGLAGLAVASTANASFVQGFETDITGWETPTRVASGTHGITSFSGGYHAETAQDSGDFTRWGGYNYGAGNNVATVFQPYTTSLAIYLNVNGGAANDTRFDWSSAICNSSGGFLRDFVFNAGFYSDASIPGSGNRFVISASNNAGRSDAYPENPGRDPFVISSTGWYIFTDTFYNNGGVLAADLSIRDASSSLLHTWTLSSTADTIGNVGGNRYGWFVNNEFDFLAIDQSMLTTSDAPYHPDMAAVSGCAPRHLSANFWLAKMKPIGTMRE